MSSYSLIMLLLLVACAAPGPDAPVGELVEVVVSATVLPADLPRRTVEVRGGSGAPIQDAEIVIAAPTAWGAWSVQEPQVRTDATGRATVYAAAEARFGARIDGGVVGVGGDVVTIERDSVLVEGIVADDDGRPLAGATVTGTTSRWPSMSGKNADPLLDQAEGTVTADAEGRFRFRHRVGEDTSLYLSVRAPGWVGDETDFPVLPGQTLWHRFELEPARTVALRCDGLPDESCATVAWSRKTSCEGSEEVRRTRVDGVVHLAMECPEGAYRIELGGVDGVSTPSKATAWFDFRDWTGGVQGTVRHDGCQVRADVANSLVQMAFGADYPAREVEVGADGTFRFDRLGPGSWRVRGCGAKGEVVEVADTMVDVGALK